jgi:hypothetical protein
MQGVSRMSAAALAPDLAPRGLDTGIYAPLPKRGTKAGEQIAWAFPEELTKEDAGHMARAMVALGLTRRLMTAPRCGTPLWYEARLPRVNALRDDKLEWPVLLMAQKTIAGRRQDQWPEAGKDTLDLVYGYILAATARQTAAFAAAPIEGTA